MAARKQGSKKKYGATVGRTVKKVMHERKQGTLKSGRSKKKVTSRKQAIAIALSEARASGAKVPKKTSRKKASGKKASGKKASGKKTSRKTTGKKATKKSASRKTTSRRAA